MRFCLLCPTATSNCPWRPARVWGGLRTNIQPIKTTLFKSAWTSHAGGTWCHGMAMISQSQKMDSVTSAIEYFVWLATCLITKGNVPLSSYSSLRQLYVLDNVLNARKQLRNQQRIIRWIANVVIDFVIYVGTNGLSPIYVKIQKIRNSFDNDNNKKMIALTVISNVVQFANVCVLFVEVTMNVNAFSGSNINLKIWNVDIFGKNLATIALTKVSAAF